MSNGSELKSRGAMALRAAGFHPLPRWWVTGEQLELVAYMARQNADEVNRIRAEANAAPVAIDPPIDRQAQIEAAWAAHRRST